MDTAPNARNTSMKLSYCPSMSVRLDQIDGRCQPSWQFSIIPQKAPKRAMHVDSTTATKPKMREVRVPVSHSQFLSITRIRKQIASAAGSGRDAIVGDVVSDVARITRAGCGESLPHAVTSGAIKNFPMQDFVSDHVGGSEDFVGGIHRTRRRIADFLTFRRNTAEEERSALRTPTSQTKCSPCLSHAYRKWRVPPRGRSTCDEKSFP